MANTPLINHAYTDTYLGVPKPANTSAGRKGDADKLPMELIPEEFLVSLAEVYKVGLHYGRENWKGGLSFRRMKGAMMRHMNKFFQGENFDGGSPTQHHLAAVAFYCAAIIYFQARNRADLDDRDVNASKI